MAISHSPPIVSPSPSPMRHGHNQSYVDNALFIVSVLLFTMALLTAAFTTFALCFKRFSRHRPPLETTGDSVGLQSLPQKKPVAERFPEFVYESKNGGDEGLECAVCLSEFKEEEMGRLLPACNHSFHVDCIDKWLNSHSTCPICRTTASVDRRL